MASQGPLSLKDRWVLVTGATSGLGQSLAVQLAGDGAHLALVARSPETLSALAGTLTSGGAQVKTIAADLAHEDGCQAVLNGIAGLPVTAAILNAGVTHIGAFEEADAASYQAMIDLNVSGVTAMSLALLPLLKAQHGALMLTASLGGLTALPYQSVYAGTKAFLVNFGLSLAAERQSAPASVTVFAPGGIETRMTARPEFKGQSKYLMDPSIAARHALTGLYKRKTLVIPGVQNKLMASALKFLPRRWASTLTERSFRRSIAAAKPKG